MAPSQACLTSGNIRAKEIAWNLSSRDRLLMPKQAPRKNLSPNIIGDMRDSVMAELLNTRSSIRNGEYGPLNRPGSIAMSGHYMEKDLQDLWRNLRPPH